MNKYLLLIISVSASQAAGLQAQTWSTLDSGISYPTGYVATLAQHQDQLYAGGFFYNASGVPANNVARWNGSNWSALGNGLGTGSLENVQCLASYNGDLYAGGYFTLNPLTDSSSSIAKWNGSQWVRVGSIPVFSVRQLTVYNGELYAAAYFPTLFPAQDSVFGTCLAKWNGSQWSQVGNGPDGIINYVNCMIVHDGELYIAGYLIEGGGRSRQNVLAKWNGTSWSTISNAFDGPVAALASYNGELYAGGHFFSIDTLSTSQIARWNGTRWSTVGTGINYYTDEIWASSVNTLSVYRGALYAGGFFYHAGVVNTANIAKWDGSSWSGLGRGANYWVTALSATDSVLYVGGWFRYVDGNIEARKIAKWKENCPSAPILSPSDSIRGSRLVCGGSTQHYYLPPIAGALSYSWNLPGGWSGQSTNNSIRVTTGNSSGTITVSAIGSCNSNSTSLAITIIPVPPTPGPISGNAAICLPSNFTYTNPYGISISPNPSNGPFLLRAYGLEGKSIQLELLNMAGQQIYRTGKMPGTAVYSHTLRLDSYAQGIYLLRIQVDNRVFLRKIEKIN
ncbi:MAG TPA: T9SS type A sorting domain-containing protein [Chitinophagaceae bacterium]|nr:T9SS type A sorting domain-containing protein [Chitinophagaceae bacterium]